MRWNELSPGSPGVFGKTALARRTTVTAHNTPGDPGAAFSPDPSGSSVSAYEIGKHLAEMLHLGSDVIA